MKFGKKYAMSYHGNMFQRFKYIFKNNQKYIYIMKQKYAKRTIKDITNYKKHFFYFALFSLFVTILAFYKIQTIPDYLVMIFALFFHVIAVIGSFFIKIIV